MRRLFKESSLALNGRRLCPGDDPPIVAEQRQSDQILEGDLCTRRSRCSLSHPVGEGDPSTVACRVMRPPQTDRCELCGRDKPLTFHHLIPRKMHRKRRIRAQFRREEMVSRGLWVCRLCHRQVHRLYNQEELATRLNTRGALASAPEMNSFLRWARKQK